MKMLICFCVSPYWDGLLLCSPADWVIRVPGNCVLVNCFKRGKNGFRTGDVVCLIQQALRRKDGSMK